MPLDHARTVLIFAPGKSPQNVAVSGKDGQRSILLLMKPMPVVEDVEVCLEMMETVEIGPCPSDGEVNSFSCEALDHKLPDSP